jgi:hypothetical protein
MRKKKLVDPIPEEFTTYQDAAEFWDTHDTTRYPDTFRTVKVTSKFRHRDYEILIAPDIAEALRVLARAACFGQSPDQRIPSARPEYIQVKRVG